MAEGRDAESIQREIERTRAELADTVDAIVDKVSPRRAAVRAVASVKGRVAEVRGESNGHVAALEAPAGQEGVSTYESQRSLRTDRVLIAAGALTAVAVVVVLWRRRR